MPSLGVGIDVGGTKTHVALGDGAEVLNETTVASAEWGDFRTWAAALSALIDSVCKGYRRPEAVVVGAHGCDSGEQCERLRAHLRPLVSTRCAVVNDAELLAPIAGLQQGVGLVSGTGSVAVGYDRDDRVLIVGGWGWLFGDEGSGAGIVREAARAVMAAHDLGQPNDSLADMLLDAFGVASVPELSGAMTQVRNAAEWAARSPRVFEAADARGSKMAAGVIEEGGRSLALLIDRLAQRGADVTAVAVGGGVITTQPLLQRAFTSALATLRPETIVHVVDQSPVMGALILARELVNGGARLGYACLRRSLTGGEM